MVAQIPCFGYLPSESSFEFESPADMIMSIPNYAEFKWRWHLTIGDMYVYTVVLQWLEH